MRIPLLAALLIACAGCDGSWQWRDRTYALPEQAVEAQRKDLDREVAHVTKVLDEDRVAGAAIALLPTRPVRLRISGAKDAEQGTYRVGLAANEAAAGAKAADRAELFSGGCVVAEVEDPDNVAIPPSALWVLQYLPVKNETRMRWWLVGVEQGRYVPVADVPPSGDDRFDRFVDGLQAAVRQLRDGQGTPWPKGEVARLGYGSAWLPAAARHEDEALVARFGGLIYTLSGVDGRAGDAQDEIGAHVKLLSAQAKVGPRVDLPAKAPAEVRARMLSLVRDGTVIISEVQAVAGRNVSLMIQGPPSSLLLPGKGDTDLRDEDLAPGVRRVLSSLALSP